MVQAPVLAELRAISTFSDVASVAEGFSAVPLVSELPGRTFSSAIFSPHSLLCSFSFAQVLSRLCYKRVLPTGPEIGSEILSKNFRALSLTHYPRRFSIETQAVH